jgi:hypothetical protein
MRRALVPLASAASSSSMIGRVCMPSPDTTLLKRRRQCRGNGEQRLAAFVGSAATGGSRQG